MAAKDLEFGDDARNRMIAGVNMLADAATITPGPRGRTVMLERSFGAPPIIKDETILTGGGVARVRCHAAVAKLKGENHEPTSGIKILLRALDEPSRQIVANAGGAPAVVLDRAVQSERNCGYDALTGEEYGDLVKWVCSLRPK